MNILDLYHLQNIQYHYYDDLQKLILDPTHPIEEAPNSICLKNSPDPVKLIEEASLLYPDEITVLDISSICLSEDLIESLYGLQSVEVLIVSSIQVSNADSSLIESLISYILSCDFLYDLDISMNSWLRDYHIRELLPIVSQLQKLNVSNCHKISDESIYHICSYQEGEKLKSSSHPLHNTTSSSCSITYLDVSGCIKVTDDGFEQILNNLRNIQTLVLKGCLKITGL